VGYSRARLTALEIVLLVVGILAVQVILWSVALRWVRRAAVRIAEEMRQAIAGSGERLVRGPEQALYRGASGRFPRAKGNMVIAMTDRRLVCRRLVGAEFAVPLDEIAEVREARWFLRASQGRMHVVMKLKDGVEVGFMTPAHTEWMDALRARAAG
jgi:hypothetical protein